MLRVLASLLGPIFAKEAVEIARRKRYYVNRVLYGLALFVALFLVWQRYDWADALNHVGMSRMAAKLFVAVSSVQYGAVFLFVPLFVGGVLAGEREEHTLELLFTTRLTDTQIVLGKLCSRLAALVLLVLFALPILCLLPFFGGVDPAALWRATAATLLAVGFVGAHAVYFSAVTPSPVGALARTYWWLAVEVVIMPLLVFIPVKAAFPASHPVSLCFLGAVHLVNPLPLFLAAVNGEWYDLLATNVGTWLFPAAFVLPTAWSGFLVWRAVGRVRRDPTPFSLPVRRLPVVRSVGAWLNGLGERLRRRVRVPTLRLPARREVANPLWQRARLARVYDRQGHLRRIQTAGWWTAFAFLLLLVVTEPRALRSHEAGPIFLGFTWAGVAGLAALLAGASLAGDRRRGFFDFVLITPLTGRQIVDGTLLAVWEHLRRVYWLPFVLGFFFCLTGASTPVGVLCSLLTATLVLTLIVLYGVACSLAARSVPGALVPTFLVPVFLLVGTLVLMALFRGAHGLALWVLTGGLLVGSRYWPRRRVSAAAVGTFLLAGHLALACVASGWTFDPDKPEYPLAAMHPGFLTLVTMDRNYPRDFLGKATCERVLPCYWAALVINLIWARWWVIRNFDRLVGRTEPLPKMARPAAPAPPATPEAIPAASVPSNVVC
jgi:ABC-2 family transporter protein